ncbi:unnamed protein product [Microthlaspi erraticum]|uniref:J domain-containing protein n=1 Tax=Microthlaspi erraticum TaxID=1685480 RepID=A0A6D2JHZ5_9BRAS|nr:unnamed protein product [Microthlaspi erraticum]
MEGFVDHYLVLGLPSGEEALKLSEKEITRAFKLKALVSHPDKRPDDPNAHDDFQRIKTSYEVLKDETERKLFDHLLRVQIEKQRKKSQGDSKRRKMMSDLDERERSASAPNHSATTPCDEEERISRRLKEEVDMIRARHAKKRKQDRSGAGASSELDKERMLKVSWEKHGEGYTATRLKQVFSEFGEVKDVVTKITKTKRSALVVMATKDEAVAATRTLCGHLSNPLLVVPVLRADQTDFLTAEAQLRSDIVGAAYDDLEDAVMQKLRKAAMNQK